jgi:hypothetical protein
MTATTVSVRELGVLNLEDARLIAGTREDLAAAIGKPFPQWARQCHAISLALLRTGRFGRGRVARGVCEGVSSQHSWIVLGDDCYDPDATVVDPTLWSYDSSVQGILVTRNLCLHTPHGSGSCYAAPMPSHYGGESIDLTPAEPLSEDALDFLDQFGSLDRRGWGEVAHLPAEGWPAAEIIGAMCDTPGLGVLVPIDIVGHLTDRNPNNLYW